MLIGKNPPLALIEKVSHLQYITSHLFNWQCEIPPGAIFEPLPSNIYAQINDYER